MGHIIWSISMALLYGAQHKFIVDKNISKDIHEWNDSKAKMYMESGFMNIATSQFEDSDEINCKVVSPARIMQWILSGK